MSAYVTPHPFLKTLFRISAARKHRLITTNKLLILLFHYIIPETRHTKPYENHKMVWLHVTYPYRQIMPML
jgi:hypothetical protein